MFVDHAGDTVDIINPITGETRPAYIFVAVLGASNYTYAEATWTRDLTDWVASHTRALQFFQGVTKLVVPDQWRAGVSRPCYWEPELNRTYQDWATHYGVAIVPPRPRHARDKACASYCTLFRFDSGQDWLGGSTTAVALHDCDIPERLI